MTETVTELDDGTFSVNGKFCPICSGRIILNIRKSPRGYEEPLVGSSLMYVLYCENRCVGPMPFDISDYDIFEKTKRCDVRYWADTYIDLINKVSSTDKEVKE